MKKYNSLIVAISIISVTTLLQNAAAASQGTNSDNAKSCAKIIKDSKLDFVDDGDLNDAWLEKMRSAKVDAQQERINEAVQTAGYQKASLNREVVANHNESYTNELSLGCVADQKSSGRCWIFAGSNMLREGLVNDKKVDPSFQFSYTYLHFFNILEKSNRMLWRIENAQVKNLTRAEELRYIDKIGDGGWYNWFKFLVSKYGLVPASAMPETAESLNTASLNTSVMYVISSAGDKIKSLTQVWNSQNVGSYTAEQKQTLLTIRQETMQKIYEILRTHLGTPPTKFTFRNKVNHAEKAEKAQTHVTQYDVREYTPAQFRDEFVKYNPDDYVLIMNSPFQPYGKLIEMTDSTIGVPSKARENYSEKMLNLPFYRMDELIRASIDSGSAVWFGTDVGQSIDRADQTLEKPMTGVWHSELYRADQVYGQPNEKSDFNLSRRQRMQFRLANLNHAMVFVAYDRPVADAPTIKYKVGNSWGDKFGNKGYGNMYRGWAEQNLDQIVVRKSLLNSDELNALKQQPLVVDEDDIF